MSGASLRLGIDLGTSAVKVVVLDAAGVVAATSEAAYPTYTEIAGQAEQEPEQWLNAAAAALGKVAGELGGDWSEALISIGLTGQLPTLVCLGASAPLGRAIAWTDSRADGWAAGQLTPERRQDFYRKTGMPIDGRYLAPMFRFHWQERQAEVRHVLSAKDFLCFALTGRTVTDPSTAAGYGVYSIVDGRWDEALCAFWKLPPELLPTVLPADQVAGALLPSSARRLGLPSGIPVGVGAADSVAGALAMTGLSEGAVSLIMGSSTIVLAAGREPLLDPHRRYLVTPHARGGWYGREMDLLATGSGFGWLCGLFGWTGDNFEEAALTVPAGSRGLYFSPYLAGGEQGALWNPALRGVLHGLTLSHGRPEIARAFLEGTFFEIRRCLDVLEESAPITTITASGHAAARPAVMAMLADVLNRPVRRFLHHAPPAIGAARLTESDGAANAAFDAHAPCEPGPASAQYDYLYRCYLDLFPRIAEAPGGGAAEGE